MTKRALAVLVFAASALGLSGPVKAVLNSDCAAPVPGTPASLVSTCFYDLTAISSSTEPSTFPAAVLLNGGMFRVPPTPEGAYGEGYIVGTGVFQPFVRIQEPGNGNNGSNGIEAGYNTNGRDGVGQAAIELDNHDKGGTNWNHAIKLSDIPIVTVCADGTNGTAPGPHTGCLQYYEFLLDVNEQGNSPNGGISMDEFKVFTAATGDIHDYINYDASSGYSPTFKLGTGAGIAPVYDMDAANGGDASILMDYRNFSGSGNGVDLQALVPVTNFAGATGDFVYLYSKFGWTGAKCMNVNGSGAVTNKDSECMTPDGNGGSTPIAKADVLSSAGSLNFEADAGFEEWSFRKKTGMPVPSTILLFGIGLAAFAYRRRLATA